MAETIVRVGLRGDASQLTKTLTTAQTKLKQFGQSAKQAGQTLSRSATLPLAAAGVASIKMASDFEASMTKISTLVGLSAEAVEGFKGDVLALSGETARAPKELADAMFFITSAGLRGSVAVDALEASAKAAALGMGETEVVADAVTNAINGYGAANITAAEATDILVKTVEQGKAAASELAPQFGRLIPMAAELGISFDQVGAGMAFLTRSSGDAAMSATQLFGVMKSIIKPSQQARGVLDDLGLGIHGLRRAVREDGLLTAIQDLRGRLESSGLEMTNVFEDARGLGGALQLTGVQAGIARDVFAELTRSAGALDRGFEIVQHTTQFKLQKSMATLKASMITLGEKVIPVVIPVVVKLANTLGQLADMFSRMSPTAQTFIVAMGAMAAVAGPLLVAIGAISAAVGALGVSIAVLAGPIAAFIAVGAVLTTIFVRQAEEAKADQKRVELLREELAAAGDTAGTVAENIAGLTERLVALGEAMDVTAGKNDVFTGSAVLMQELLDRDMRETFNQFVTDMDTHNAAIAAGSDEYENMANRVNLAIGQTQANIDMLNKHRDALGADADAIIAAVAAGDLQADALKAIFEALDKTADATDDNIKKNTEAAKEWLGLAENTLLYERVLDDNTLAQIRSLKTQGLWVMAMNTAIRGVEAAEEAQAAHTRAIAQSDAAMLGSAARLGVYKDAEWLAAEATAALRDRVAEMTANIEAGLDPLGRTAAELEHIASVAAGADRALIGFAKDSTDEAKNRAHWEGVVRAERQALLDEEKRIADALQAQKDALQANIVHQEALVESAEAYVDQLEAAADAAREPVRLLKERVAAERKGFDALRGMFDASNDLADAQASILTIEEQIAKVRAGGGDAIEEATVAYNDQMRAVAGFARDMANALDEQARITGEIADLTAQRAFIENQSGQFQRELTRELNAQRLAYFDINTQVAELQGRQQELSADAVAAQRAMVATLQAEAAAITGVEQALVDLGVVTLTDAAQANITAKQAKNLIRLAETVAETAAAVDAGEASTIDLLAAQEDMTNAIVSALRPTSQLTSAQQKLAQMESEAARIGLQLAVAIDKQTAASESLASAQDTVGATAEAVDVVNRKLLDLALQHRQAIDEETTATELWADALETANALKDTTAIRDAELLRLSGELEDAQWLLVAAQFGVVDAEVALADAGDKVSVAIDRMTAVSPALAAEMITMAAAASATYPQFDLMRSKLAVLDPQIAAAKTRVDALTDGLASLVRQMEILNGTKLNPLQVPAIPAPGGGFTGPSGPSGSAAIPIPTIVVPDTSGGGIGGLGGGEGVLSADALLSGVAFDQLIDDTLAKAADTILSIKQQAELQDFLANIDKFDLPPGPGPITQGGPWGQGPPNMQVTVNVEGSVTSERDLTEQIRRGLLQAQKSGKQLVL